MMRRTTAKADGTSPSLAFGHKANCRLPLDLNAAQLSHSLKGGAKRFKPT